MGGATRAARQLDRRLRCGLLLLAVLATGAPLAGDPPAGDAKAGARPALPHEAAEEVVAAVDGGRAADLRALAARRPPDPWQVVEELVVRDRADAAVAYAGETRGRDVERLPSYAATSRDAGEAAARQRRLAAGYAALREGRLDDALEAFSTPSPAQDVGAVNLHFGRGVVLGRMRRRAESAEAYRASAETAEAIGWLACAAIALQESAETAYAGGDFRAALRAGEDRARIEVLRGNRLDLARTLHNLGLAHSALGDRAKAMDHYERALRMKEEVGDRATTATTLTNIGGIHQAAGRFDEALAYFERALAVDEEFGDAAGVAADLVNIGAVHFVRRDFPKALELQERAARLYREAGDREGLAAAFRTMAALHRSVGSYAEAMSRLRRALAIQEELGDPRAVTGTLEAMAGLHHLQGDYATAFALYERAAREHQERGDRLGHATALANLGTLHGAVSDYRRALEHLERALRICEELDARQQLPTLLANVGNAHGALGEHDRAIEIYDRALRLHEEDGNRTGIASTHDNLGTVHAAAGRFAKALEHQQRSLDAYTELGDPAGQGHALGNMAIVLHASGEPTRALERARESLARALETGSRDRVVSARTTLARIQLTLDAPADAVATARLAVAEMGSLVGGLAEGEGAGARSLFADVFETGAQAALRTGSTADLWYFLESGRAGTLLEALGGRTRLQAHVVPPALRRQEAEARAAEAVALDRWRRAAAGTDRAETRRRRAEFEAARESVHGAVARIQREAKASAGVVYPEPDSLAEVRSSLREGEVLVQYGLFAAEAGALVVTPQEARWVGLGPTTAIVEAYGAALGSTERAVVEDRLGTLRDRVVAPLGLPSAARRVLVSPDGVLAYVPFALLLEAREVACVPSGTVYRRLAEERKARGDGVLAIGDPDPSAHADAAATAVYARRVRGGLAGLGRLPAARVEAKAVGDVVLLDTEATEENLGRRLGERPRWRAVHFACHGLIDPERPTLCSLALTGSASQDGFLTVLDVFRLPIPCDLVALSACQTARGKVVRGEGIVGLTRAFMFAGAPRVLCSLWKVDDDATQALMKRFYALWNPKDGTEPLGTAAALRAAQDHVRSDERWKHPYYWAAWVLWGLAD